VGIVRQKKSMVPGGKLEGWMDLVNLVGQGELGGNKQGGKLKGGPPLSEKEWGLQSRAKPRHHGVAADLVDGEYDLDKRKTNFGVIRG